VWDSFERVDKVATLTAESQVVLNLVNAGATLEGAAAVVEWPEEMVRQLLNSEQVDGIEL
jgi:ligand-binding SRPBCC domain-containing protein